jgi:predicted nucleic acid-binding protein
VAFYIETSAFLKLAVEEDGSPAMRRWFTDHRPCWSSQLLATEAHRAAMRLGLAPELIEELLDSVSLILPSASTFELAGRLGPVDLRSLDAVHLAAAGEIGPELEGVVTYDRRLVLGAAAAGFPVIQP